MSIFETIIAAKGGGAVNQLAAQFGLNPEQAQAAVAALVPALATGLKRNMATESAASGLASALQQGGHEAYLDDLGRLSQPTTTQDGNAILGHILGSKEVSRQVATQASQKTGIDPSVLKKMLPLVAALAMGSLSKQAKSGGLAAGGRSASGGGLASMLGPMLDRDGDGSMMDDVGGMLRGMLGDQKRG
jgi:hypothetical protein